MSSNSDVLYDINEIKRILPHRYPFIMIDKVISRDGDDEIIAFKNVTINEPFFQGHFPEHPVMPGVLIIEAMAQAGAFLARKRDGADLSKTFYLVGTDEFKWRKQVVPGDVIQITMKLLAKKSFLWKMQGTATVDGEVVASGILTAAEK